MREGDEKMWIEEEKKECEIFEIKGEEIDRRKMS